VIASTVEGITILLLWRAAAAQLPCHFSFLPMNVAAAPACFHPVPFVGRRAWLPALLLGGMVLATLVLASWELVRQLLRIVRLNRSLNALGESKGTDQQPFVSSGVTRYQVVPTDALLCFCVGLLRPRVVVSTAVVDELSPAELRAALAHEASHQRRHDPLRLLVGRVATRALFFIPSLRELQWGSRVTTEIAADAAAARNGDTVPLLGALRRLMSPDAPRAPVAVSAMAPTGLLPERIAALTGDRPPIVVRPARLAVSAAAFALVILLALAVPSGTPLPRLLPVHLVHPVPVHPVRGGGRD